MVDKCPLVGEPALGEDLQQGIPGFRLSGFAAGDGGIEGSQVVAVEVADEVGRA